MKLKNIYSQNRFWINLIVLLLGILAVSFLFFLYEPVREITSNLDKIKIFLLNYGDWAILVYVLLSIVVVVIPILPNEIVPIVGGAVFGFWVALVFGLIARIIGSSINYLLGTKIGNKLYKKLTTDKEEDRLNKFTKKMGWQVIFISRFLPSTDTDLVAYAAGIAKMHYGKFILASFFGMLVPVSVTIAIGESLVNNRTLFFVFIAFYVVGILFAPKIFKKMLRYQDS